MPDSKPAAGKADDHKNDPKKVDDKNKPAVGADGKPVKADDKSKADPKKDAGKH